MSSRKGAPKRWVIAAEISLKFHSQNLNSSGRLWKIALHPFNPGLRSEEHTSELQSLMRISYAVFCLKKKIISIYNTTRKQNLRRYKSAVNILTRFDKLSKHTKHNTTV